MTLRKGLLMTILLVIGGIVLLRLERDAEQIDRTVTQKGVARVFPGITQEQVTSARVVNADGSYALIKHPTDTRRPWRLENPPNAPVAQKTADMLISQIVNLESENYLSADEVSADQSVYGLGKPELFLTLKGEFGERKMSFGMKHAVSGRRYLQPENDGRIYLVDNAVFDGFNTSGDALRDRHPAAFEPEHVASVISLNVEGRPMVFTRVRQADGMDFWRLEADGKQSVADGDVLFRELTELAGMEAADFIDNAADVMPLLGLTLPKLTLRLQLEADASGQARELLLQIGQGIGADNSQGEHPALKTAYYLKVSGEPWAYRFEKAFFSDWLQPAEHFRDRTPYDAMSAEDIAAVRVERGGKDAAESFKLSRAGEDEGAARWELAKGAGGTAQAVSADRVNEWLEHLFMLKVISYPALGASAQATYGLESPFLKITVDPAGGDAPAQRKVLSIGSVLTQAEGAKGVAGGDSSSPRYGGIAEGDGAPVPVVLSGAVVDELSKPAAYFLK